MSLSALTIVGYTLLFLLSAVALLVLALYRQAARALPEYRAHYDQERDVLFDHESERSIRRRFDAVTATRHLQPNGPQRSVMVIGSGLSGLMSAVTLAKTGKYRVLVLEQHDRIGGCTHTFDDKGFSFDVGVHYVGQQVWDPASPFRAMMDSLTDGNVEWQTLHTEPTDTHPHTDSESDMDYVYDVLHFEDRPSEPPIKVRAGTQRGRDRLRRQFPSEVAAIDRYYRVTIRIWRESQWLLVLRNTGLLSFLPSAWYQSLEQRIAPTYHQYLGQTTESVLLSWTSNKLLLAILSYVNFDYGSSPSHSSFVAHAIAANYFYRGTAYPVGGPSQIAKHAVRVLSKHGGLAMAQVTVNELIVENDRCVGVVVRYRDSNVKLYSDIVISSTGARHTYLSLMPPSLPLERFPTIATARRELAENDKPQSLSQAVSHFSLFLGYEGDIDECQLPRYNTFVFPSVNITMDTDRWYSHESIDEALVSDSIGTLFIMWACAKDPTAKARHPGKITGQILVECNYNWFAEFADEGSGSHSADYHRIKKVLTETLLKKLHERFPQLAERAVLRYCELGTGLTSAHYLGATHGSSYGMTHTPARFESYRWLSATTELPALYLTGTDTTLAGLYGAVSSGLLTACAVDRQCLGARCRFSRAASSVASSNKSGSRLTSAAVP